MVEHLRMAPLMWLTCPSRQPLDLSRPHIMGVLNVTPDSFSDGGLYGGQVESAVGAALAMARQGASVIDVGGESTRPGAQRISVGEQQRRVVPVIERLRTALDEQGHEAVWISIDTTLGPVAEAALQAGASMMNDVSAGRDDASVFDLAASGHVPIVLMHMQGTPATMQQNPTYDPAKGGVVGEVLAFLAQRAEHAQRAGLASNQIVLDPGIGFGKTPVGDNLQLLGNLPRLVALGYPVIVGASRKSFIGRLSPTTDSAGAEAGVGRLGGSVALTCWAVGAGVPLHRVHDVQANRQAADVTHGLSMSGT